ncbi:hypothetical protein AVEN_112657-1 [Araneus ventricosus]|uniref:Uncharacterized protein n=1 Tax=Araneus ventricosus TaxID=182803 RepID=A0A4Y2HV09_ARAVE|nr:hypothetical protein AVEN_112657-1 [Araneus ventricosus]
MPPSLRFRATSEHCLNLLFDVCQSPLTWRFSAGSDFEPSGPAKPRSTISPIFIFVKSDLEILEIVGIFDYLQGPQECLFGFGMEGHGLNRFHRRNLPMYVGLVGVKTAIVKQASHAV